MKSLYENAGNVVRPIYDLRIKGPPVLDVATDFPSAELFQRLGEHSRRGAGGGAEDAPGAALPRDHARTDCDLC